MATQQFCESCHRIFRGEVVYISDPDSRINDKRNWFVHHPDAESFSKAIELPCSICVPTFRSPLSTLRHIPRSGTQGSLQGFNRANGKTEGWDCFKLILGSRESGSMVLFFERCGEDVKYRHQFPLSAHTSSPSSVDFFQEKYKDCRRNHAGCRIYGPTNTPGPARVVEVGDSALDLVYLRNTPTSFTDFEYACLSYCWGQASSLKLTKSTESSLRNGISASNLPRTFKDAIEVTRKLNLRYLWIDSLCIFQDEREDWARESRGMHNVYRQSACTLAASSAEDSNRGLFFERGQSLMQFGTVSFTNTAETKEWPLPGEYWYDHKDRWIIDVNMAPLAYRAWVCQERHLSPRIIHFTKSALYWECQTEKASEVYRDRIPFWAYPLVTLDPSLLKELLHAKELESKNTLEDGTRFTRISLRRTSKKDIYLAWAHFVNYYSRCNLTVESDKLVALQGIAAQVSAALDDELVAGLWRGNLMTDLCWRAEHRSEMTYKQVQQWRGPSWSWASVKCLVWPSLLFMMHIHCDTPLAHPGTSVTNISVKARVSGELERGSLQIHGKPLQVRLQPKRHTVYQFDFEGTVTFGQTTVEVIIGPRPQESHNITFDAPYGQESRLAYMVILQQCLHGVSLDDCHVGGQRYAFGKDRKDNPMLEGLLLEPVSKDIGTYQRVGSFSVDGPNSVADLLKAEESIESTVITLV